MSSLNFNISGLSTALAKIDQLGTGATKIVEYEIKAFGVDTVNDAKANTPVDLGYLRNSIQFNTVTPLEAFINVNAFYAAYVEFGTGAEVFISDFIFTPEMKAYAATFFVNGKGNLPARPYLFPAYEKNRILLIERFKGYTKAA